MIYECVNQPLIDLRGNAAQTTLNMNVLAAYMQLKGRKEGSQNTRLMA